MQYLHLGKEAREALDEPALQLLEKYDAEIMEAMPPSFDNTELQEYSDKYTAELRQKASYHLGRYFQAEGGGAALSELAQNLQPIIATIKSLFSQFTEAKRLEKELSKPLGILKLDSTITAVLYPHAQRRFNDWKEELNKEVPELEELTIEEIRADINEHADDDKKAQVRKDEESIVDWLAGCVDRGGEELNSTAYAGWVISSMSSIRGLLKKVYERKEVKAEEERQRQEEEARKEEYNRKWDAAYKAISPPDADAHKYLTPEKYQKYEDSIPGAVRVYMEKGKLESGLNDSFDYRQSLWLINYRKDEERQEIKDRKEKERQQIIANLAAREFNNSLSKHIAGLKSKLNNRPRDLRNYFTAGIRDKRYTGHNFDYVLDDEQKRNFDRTLVSIANDKLKQIIPRDLLEFIKIPDTYWRLYFSLPSISYSFEGIPCLDFNFDIFVTAHAEVLLKPKVKKFGICSFNLPAEKEGNVLIPLEEPKLLGYFHVFLRPEDLDGYVPWQTIPLILLQGLLNGETKPGGVTISAASDGMITYKVPKFKEEITIPDSFASYLRSIGSIDEMVRMGIITGKIAGILKSELGELAVEREASSLEGGIKRRDSKKAKTFALFSEGKRPSDSEVKSLGIKPESTYRYYQDWKKAHNSSKNPT